MSFALYCMLFVILLVFPETDGGQITWNEPLPILTVKQTDVSTGVHRNRTRLIEDTINASLSWYFSLSSGLTFLGVNLKLETDNNPIAAVDNQKQEVTAGFKDRYAINWIPNERITLVIFKVTSEHNATFACEVVASENGISTWRSQVQVYVVARPSNIISDDQTITAPTKLTLKCSADGKPTPTIFWTRVSDNTNVSMPLNITGGKKEESYRCTAYNGIGNPLSKVVKITILFSPKVILAQKFFVGREETASLYCEVEGNPPPTISWSPCDEGNPFCNEQYLNISRVESSRANYMCTARNRVGTASGTTVLLIGGKNIYLRLSVIGECDKNISVWEALVKELPRVFANTTQNYSGAELLKFRCGSLIFDVALKFTSVVAEKDTISIIQNATKDGKLGELSLNVSHIVGISRFPRTTTTAPTSTTPKSDDNNTGLIIGAVLGGVAFVALIFLIVWCVRKKKCCCETKEVSDKNADAGQGRKGKGPNGADEVAYASTSMLPNSKRPVEKTNQSTVQALPMYAQVDKTKKTSNKGGTAQRQPGELQYAEVEHVTSGKSLPRKSSSEPIKPSNEEIVYADLV